MPARRPPRSFVWGLLVFLEVLMIMAALLFLALGFLLADTGWLILAVLIIVVLIVIHLAQRNHRMELNLHRRQSQVSIPTVPQIPTYDRTRERRAPQPTTVSFPSDRYQDSDRFNTSTNVMPTTTMACPNCGAPVRRGARFCHRCGRPLATA